MAVVPIQGLWETHLTVSDLERSVAFYRDTIGLELAHRVPARGAAFFWIGVPRQANGRDDRGSNDQSRLHARLLFHLLRPGHPLPRNCSLHLAHQCTAVCTGLGPSLYERFPRKISDGR